MVLVLSQLWDQNNEGNGDIGIPIFFFLICCILISFCKLFSLSSSSIVSSFSPAKRITKHKLWLYSRMFRLINCQFNLNYHMQLPRIVFCFFRKSLLITKLYFIIRSRCSQALFCFGASLRSWNVKRISWLWKLKLKDIRGWLWCKWSSSWWINFVFRKVGAALHENRRNKPKHS